MFTQLKRLMKAELLTIVFFEELSKMNFGLESNKPNTTVPTELTTTVATVDEPVTAIPITTSATSATKPVS